MLRYAVMVLLAAGCNGDGVWFGDCTSTGEFTTRITILKWDGQEFWETKCCKNNDQECYSENPCNVAVEENGDHYQCCGHNDDGNAVCLTKVEDSCGDSWCSLTPPPPRPAPPASEELSSGAIGGIVVGAYLGVAGAFGAFAAYRGVAAGV